MDLFDIWYWAIVALSFLAYVSPGLIACHRRHVNARTVTLLNLALGWTGLGWIAAFVWSLAGNVRRSV
jgi:hypothetical protein